MPPSLPQSGVGLSVLRGTLPWPSQCLDLGFEHPLRKLLQPKPIG